MIFSSVHIFVSETLSFSFRDCLGTIPQHPQNQSSFLAFLSLSLISLSFIQTTRNKDWANSRNRSNRNLRQPGLATYKVSALPTERHLFLGSCPRCHCYPISKNPHTTRDPRMPKKVHLWGESSPLTKGQTCIRLKLPNSTPFRCILKQKQEKKIQGKKWQKKTKQARNKTTVLQYESLKNSKVVCKFEEKGYTFRNRWSKEGYVLLTNHL